MSIFRRGEPLGSSTSSGDAGPRFKIRITTVDGQALYWHKAGKLHTVEEDVARVFVAHFKPQLFQVLPDGHLTPPQAGRTKAIAKVEIEPA